MHKLTRTLVFSSLLFVVAATNLIEHAHAGDGCCDRCGCVGSCQKICRLVRADKKITTVCWGCKREDFCVNGRSTYLGRECDIVCDDETDPKAPCTQPKKLSWGSWAPNGCASIYTRTKLMKRTITKTVPSFKYVVEELCSECEAKVEVPEIPPGVQVPPPPKTDIK